MNLNKTTPQLIKVCFWMNIPSHHQRDFFQALNVSSEIDLVVRYFKRVPKSRTKLGWEENIELLSYEKYVEQNLNSAISTIIDLEKRIHIVPGINEPFIAEVLDFLIDRNCKWVHWSERSGVNLANILNFNTVLFYLSRPLFLRLKGYHSYAKKINKYAIGAFAQGILAKKDFVKWGILDNRIEYLFYNINALQPPTDSVNSERKIFCYLGALSRRKGTDTLIKAFSKLENHGNWKLLLIGPDQSNGQYLSLTKKLNLLDKIQFVGTIPVDQINKYIYESDVFVFPSRFDGWGVVLNEAASLSKPIIASDQAGSTHHLVINKKNGFIFEKGNQTKLAKAMQFYIDNPEQISKHGKESSNIFKTVTPEENVKRFIGAIKKWSQ